MTSALHLTIENAVCGSINGEKLKQVSLQEREDKLLSVVLKRKATHNDDRGRYKQSSDFRGLRDATHIALLAPVMLTQNQIYEVNIVSLGLMNGARGHIVAIIYDDQSGYPTHQVKLTVPRLRT